MVIQVAQKNSGDAIPKKKVVQDNDLPLPNSHHGPIESPIKSKKPVGKKIRKHFRFIWRDLLNKEYIPLKIVFFFLLGAGVSLLPYNVVHMKALGLTVEEMGIIFMLLPVIGLVSTPVLGIIGDKLGNYKHFMTGLTLTLGCVGLLYMAVPISRELVLLPDSITILMPCQSSMQPYYTQQFERPCMWTESNQTIPLSEITCGMMCEEYVHSLNDSSTNSSANFLRVSKNSTITLEPSYLPSKCSNVSRSCRNITLNISGPNVTTSDENEMKFYIPPTSWLLTESSEDPTKYLACDTSQSEAQCKSACWASVPRHLVCTNEEAYIPRNVQLAFWIYLLIRSVQAAIVGGSYSLFEGAVVIILKKSQGDFGLQRLWSSFGAMVTAPIVGIIVDKVQEIDGDKLNYRPMFYIYFGLHVVCAAFIQQLKLDMRTPATSILKDMQKLLKNLVVVAFLVAMFLAGIFWGYIESFLFWYLEEMDAPKFLMGLTLTVGTFAGVPFMMTAGPIIRRLGHVNVLLLGLAAYCVRLFGYSVINNPWHALIFEALECLSTNLMMTAAITFAGILATDTTITTLQGLYGGLHYGLGRGCGSIVGSTLMKYFGVRATFMYLGVVCFISLVLYALVHHLYLKHYSKDLERRIKEDNEKEETIVAITPLPEVYENAAYRKDVIPASYFEDIELATGQEEREMGNHVTEEMSEENISPQSVSHGPEDSTQSCRIRRPSETKTPSANYISHM